MNPSCDPTLVFELISDIITALKSSEEIEAYRYLNILREYLRKQKCDKKIIDQAIHLLKSAYPELSGRYRLILKEIIDLVQKAAKTRKRKPTKKKTRRRRRR